MYGPGLAQNASQFRTDFLLGLGLPWKFEIGATFPFAVTTGKSLYQTVSGETISMFDRTGPSTADIRIHLLWNAKSSENGGLEILFGLFGFLPTGSNNKLSGEGSASMEALFSLTASLLSTRISFNIAYKIRNSHFAKLKNGDLFEQDDDLIWRIAVRIPKQNDVAWSIEARGAIGVATDEGFWPERHSRPVWIGGGIDFPFVKIHRFGFFGDAAITGAVGPSVILGFRFTGAVKIPDEDKDGIISIRDECPMLKEDLDGFMDYDGCPDLDDDHDGFPDIEDKCPLIPASDFSDDGC
jgi:hypothetical protein